MMRSMFAGVSGLQNHQVRMDVLGNNIANVNTTGFKQGRVTFQDMLSQTIRSGTAPTSGAKGGINPAQVGLGMVIGSVDTLHTQGNLGTTGKSTDMAIQGNGFFTLSDGTNSYYSRDGAFDIGQDSGLVNPANGYRVQGWTADSNGDVDTIQDVGNISIPLGQSLIAQATSEITLAGNINSVGTNATSGTVLNTLAVHDDGGNAAVSGDALTILTNGSDVSLALTAGDIITVSAYKGGTALTSDTAVVGTDVTTYGDLIAWVEDYLGIASGESYSTYTSGCDVGSSDGEMEICGNLGEGNAITNFSLTATDSTAATDRTVFNTAMADTSVASATGTSVTSTMTIYDSQGVSHSLKLIYTKTAANTWAWTADCADDNSGGKCVTDDGAIKTLTFDTEGAYSSLTGSVAIDLAGATAIATTIDHTNLTQFSDTSSISVSDQNGYPPGTLDKFSIGSTGEITGIYTNGLTKTLAQIAVAHFANPGGLLRDGSNLYVQSTNSGSAQIGVAGSGGRGTISNGVLEMSNVDLAQVFTDMIVTQRGFQANARIITASDNMLQELVNLKR